MKNRAKSIVRSITLTIFITLFFLVLSCEKTGPKADFINLITYKKVQFMDLSDKGDGNIVRWEWSFGDDNTSTEKHPLHIYSEKDIYSVNLVVTDNNDFSDSITKEVIIPDTAKSPTIGFSYNQSSLFAVDSFEVTFTDNTENVYGFQFDVTGVTITNFEAGEVVPDDWMLSASETTVIGFSLTGSSFSPSSGVLVNLTYEATGGDVCIGEGVVSGEGGTGLTVGYGDCLEAPPEPAEVEISFSGFDAGVVEVSMTNSVDVAGFQLEIISN